MRTLQQHQCAVLTAVLMTLVQERCQIYKKEKLDAALAIDNEEGTR